MGLFGKLFKKKKQDEPKDFDLGHGFCVDEQGNISGELEISVSFNSKKTSQKIPINTSVEKLDKWLREQQEKMMK